VASRSRNHRLSERPLETRLAPHHFDPEAPGGFWVGQSMPQMDSIALLLVDPNPQRLGT